MITASDIIKIYLSKNDCYRIGKQIKTIKGIVVHSTAVNNPYVKRYVQPDNGTIGKNVNNNDWNRSGVEKCVNGFIGKDKNGKVVIVQTLPWYYAPWGCNYGEKGSFNNSHIQFEICEDDLKDKKYFEEAFGKAIELCAYLCKLHKIPVSGIVSHAEAYKLGYASNHADCDHWLKKYGKNMDWFRAEVEKILNPVFKIRVVNESTISKSAGAVGTTKIAKGVYTIVDTKDSWGKLKSGAGWVKIDGKNIVRL